MSRILRILFSIVGMMFVIIMSMNSILFITHPELTYGTGEMYHISVAFLALSLLILYFLTKFFHPQLDGSADDESALKLLVMHDVILLNIISSTTLIIYFIVNQIESHLSIYIVLVLIIFVILIWIILTLNAHIKKIRNNHLLFLNYGFNILFSSITVYLFIELFLFVNLN